QLVETIDSEGNKIRIVCNDAKVSAQEISDVYRNRWQIELFFKWVKQHLVIKKLYGKSENAVYNQLYLAMITFCLTLLMKTKLGYKGTLLEMFHWVRDCWSKSMTTFISVVFKEPDRSSGGRRRLNHEQIFKETYRKSENYVYNQLYLAMITFCLTLLMKTKLGYKGTLLEMFHWVRDCWSKSMTTFISVVFKEPERSSGGRRRLNHEQIFKE